jgi:AraC family transcriptional regulator
MHRLHQREFTIADTHGFQNIVGFTIRKTSAGLGWQHAFLSVQEEGPYKAQLSARRDVLIGLVNHGIAKGKLIANGVEYSLDGGPGTISIMPGSIGFSIQLDSTISSTHLYLRRELIELVARDLYGDDGSNVELRICAAAYDPILSHLCAAVSQALEDGNCAQCSAYVEQLLQAVAAYILRNHSHRNSSTFAGNGRLTERQLRQITEVVEARAGERLTLADIAEHFDCSGDHFGRLFKNTTGLTLYQFIIRCRIDRARYLLTNTSLPIAAIAQQCGFADQVHLTRAMRRNTGITPAAFRKRAAQLA